MRVTLKQLQVFDAVARFNSITKAADEISLSQSAVSVSLKELESGLGVELFERHKRTLTLNENGRRLQPRARTILTQVQELEGKLAAPTLKGHLRIATGTTIGNYILPGICSRFLADHPGVMLKIITCSSAEVVDRVESMKQDIGFIEATANRQQLKLIPWMEDELVIFCSPDHHLAGKVVAPEELEQEIWFVQPMGSFTRYVFATEMARHVNQINIGIETNSAESIKRAVREGLGMGCLSRIAIQAELDRGELALIKVPQMPISRSFKMILKKDVYHGEIIEAFIHSCQQVSAEALLGAAV